MAISINAIVKSIGEINNRYRDPATPIRVKLEALWEMGDLMIRLGVTKPHSIGWAIQRETKGLIKRPTVFRSHKIRTIWPSKQGLARDLGGLRGLSSLTELLPLIDPAQDVKRKLSHEELMDLYNHACSDGPVEFKNYLKAIKKRFSHGKLGKPLDRSKHLGQLHDVVSDFKRLHTYLVTLLELESPKERETFRASTPLQEFRALSNMCLALTTKDNYRLYKRLATDLSSSHNQEFKTLYEHFRSLLNKFGDVERARMRRLISAESLAEMSDMASSLCNESGVEDFKERRKLAIHF